MKRGFNSNKDKQWLPAGDTWFKRGQSLYWDVQHSQDSNTSWGMALFLIGSNF